MKERFQLQYYIVMTNYRRSFILRAVTNETGLTDSKNQMPVKTSNE